MSNGNDQAPRRTSVERNIYRRPDGAYEVGCRDGAGVQRWRTVEGGISAARALRDELVSARRRGEQVAANPRLRFGQAADEWLAGPVSDLREQTRNKYSWAMERHLRPRYATRRLGAIAADDAARLVRDLRGEGLAESSIKAVLGVMGSVYKFARRRLGYTGPNPAEDLLPSERPKPRRSRRRIWTPSEMEQTIVAAREPWCSMFTLAAVTGARLSEVCGVTWPEVTLEDLDDATVAFWSQADRSGQSADTKTDGSARVVPIPSELALILAHRKLAAKDTGKDAFVFGTRTGRAISQRNVARALRRAQTKARTPDGKPTFPILHERDERGRRVRVPRGVLPSMHGFRHTVTSRALLAGESVDEIAFLLGHRSGNVTRAVYVQEIADARRRKLRRSRMLAEYGSVMEAAAAPIGPADEPAGRENVAQLRSSP